MIKNVKIGKVGVITYHDTNGKRVKELRHPDDVFSLDTIESLKGAPYLGRRESSMLDYDHNSIIGFVYGEARPAAEFIECCIKLNAEKDAFQLPDKSEVAGAYSCDIIDESGVYNGVEYEKRQTNIRYNHVYKPKVVLGFQEK